MRREGKRGGSRNASAGGAFSGRILDGPLLQKPVPAAEPLRQIAAVLAR
jgi:hypothetical protein